MTAKEFREEFKDFEEGLRHELEFMREDKELCGEHFVGEKVNCHFSPITLLLKRISLSWKCLRFLLKVLRSFNFA